MRFSIVIPNYNSEKWIKKCLDSIKKQTFKDFEVIIVDDMSTDGSVDIIRRYRDSQAKMPIGLFGVVEKRYNGGTRNEGVDRSEGEYIIFLDCDDWFYSEKALEHISKVIDRSHPDLVRLPYRYAVKGGEGNVKLHEKSLEELTHSIFVAPWTKCIKRELFVPFPENTLIEDVSQHIEQMDKIETMDYSDIPIVTWNRLNPEAISADNKVYDKHHKRFTSIYRIVADLLELKLTKPYTIEERDKRVNWYLGKIRKGEEGTIVKFC